MKTIRVIIDNGKMVLDFGGFEGDACSDEERAVRLLLSKIGVTTDAEEERKKAEQEPNGTAERENLRNA